MADIETLPNIGPTTAAWLRAAGVPTVAALRKIGPLAAYQLCALDARAVSLTLLYALEAGLQGRHWLDLNKAERNRLRRERDALEAEAPAQRARIRPYPDPALTDGRARPSPTTCPCRRRQASPAGASRVRAACLPRMASMEKGGAVPGFFEWVVTFAGAGCNQFPGTKIRGKFGTLNLRHDQRGATESKFPLIKDDRHVPSPFQRHNVPE